jgi:hypothetical protein
MFYAHGGKIAFDTGLPDGVYICKPKIPIWLNFGGPFNEKCWYILCMVIWTIYSYFVYFWPFCHFVVIGYFCPLLVNCTKKKSGNPGLESSEVDTDATFLGEKTFAVNSS